MLATSAVPGDWHGDVDIMFALPRFRDFV